MKAPSFLAGALALAALLSPDAQAAPKVWNNLSGGSWTNGANWTPAGVPGVADTVFITNNGTYQVSLDVNVMVVSLTLGGTSGTQTLSNNASSLTFTAASAVRNNGVLILGGGSLSGSNVVTVASGGELRLTGSATKTFSTLRLLNQGTVSWLAGDIQSQANASVSFVTNAGLWRVEGNESFSFPFGGPQPFFVNTASGILRKLTGTGTTTFQNWQFRNDGTVDVQSGTLGFSGGGGMLGGAWSVAATSQILFNTGNYTSAGNATFTGPGLSRFQSGTLTLTGSGAPAGLRLEGGTLLLTATFQASGAITNLTLHGIQLAGTNTVTGVLLTTNGTFSGFLTIAPGASFTLAGTGTRIFDTLRLLNQGTVFWLAGDIQSQANASVSFVTNAGLWRIEGNDSFSFPFGGPQPFFVNAASGILRKLTGTGTTTFQGWQFRNDGTVDVQSGTLSFSGGGGVLNGAWSVAATSQILFNTGNYTSAGNATFTGPGLSRFQSGTLTLTGSGAPAGLRLEGGTLLLTATFQASGAITNLTLHGIQLAGTNTVTGVLLTTNGTFSGFLTIAPGASFTLAGTGTRIFDTLRLLNQGTVFWLAGDIQSQANASVSFVTNAGLWRIEGNDSFSFPFGGPQPFFVNAASGILRKLTGTGTTTFQGWQFRNDGTVDVQSGTLAFTGGGGVLSGAWSVAATSQILFNTGNYTSAGNATFTGPGLSRFQSGTLTLTGSGAPAGLRLEGGTLLLTATFQASGAITNLTLHGIQLAGTNTVTGVLLTTNGTFSGFLTIAPGASFTLAGTGTRIFDTLRLLNQGTVFWLAGDIQSQANASVSFVTNAGLWRIEGNDSFSFPFGGPQPFFVNAASGILRKLTGTGTTTFQGWQFRNDGTVDVQSGTLGFSGGGGMLGGAWSVAATSQILFNTGNYTSAGNATFTGPGLSRFQSGTLTLTGSGAPAGLRLEGGTLLLTATFQASGAITNLTLHGIQLAGSNTVTGVLLTTNGTFSGFLTIAPGGTFTLAGTGTRVFDTLRLLNQGTVFWLAGDIQSQANAGVSFVTNAGLWRIEGNESFSFPFGGPQPFFVNTASGILRKLTGTGTTTFQNWQFRNDGTVDVQSGTLAFTGGGGVLNGLIHLANANLTFNQPQLLGGRLQGSGTVGGTITNAGVIAPTNTGTITITGGYYQNTSAGPRLEFTLGGTAPGTNYSVLRVNGTANTGNPIVDGSLVVKLATGFSPVLASRFDVLTAATLVAGPAANITVGPATFQVQTNATRLSLLTTATGPAQPALTIVRSGGGVQVSWPATPGYVLQTTTNLNTVPGSWINVPGSPNPYNTPGTDPKRFFRLIRP